MISLRKAGPEDLPIFKESTKDWFFFRDSVDGYSFDDWFRDTLKDKSVSMTVIEAEGKPVGCLKIKKVYELSIAVSKNNRRSGYAKEAIKKVINDSDSDLMGLVSEDNEPSKNLAAVLGFKKEPTNHSIYRFTK